MRGGLKRQHLGGTRFAKENCLWYFHTEGRHTHTLISSISPLNSALEGLLGFLRGGRRRRGRGEPPLQARLASAADVRNLLWNSLEPHHLLEDGQL